MKINLAGLKKLDIKIENNDTTSLKRVTHCAICRTDAKIWDQGHRDLVLPRVLGHEIVVEKGKNRFAVWPGEVCGKCKYCLGGQENLCDNLNILGFHKDGGFADYIDIQNNNLILIPDDLRSPAATFAEPAGCIVNMFDKLQLKKDERILIYGAGTMGLMAALISKEYGAVPTVIEKSEVKIQKADFFIKKIDLTVLKNTDESNYDCIINACSDPIAFLSSIPKAAKGSRIGFFSGLDKNIQIESNLLNLIHYKEISMHGSYGLTKADMIKGLDIISKQSKPVEMLIEKVISPAEMEDVLPSVLQGDVYKYIVDFSDEMKAITELLLQSKKQTLKSDPKKEIKLNNYSINKFSSDLKAKAQHKIDNKTKPLGALGLLEDLAIKMSLIQNDLNPEIINKAIFVFAADHGVAEEGVSAFPQEVTQQMVLNFLNGGAAINVLSKHNEIDLSIIDIGVKGEVNQHNNLITERVATGTKNFALEPAMTIEEAQKSINIGYEIFNKKYGNQKIDILGLGEMGIANTTSATAIISAITGITPSQCTGRGTGVDDEGLKHKIEILDKALFYHKPNKDDALDILSKVGGFEIGGMAGAAIAAAESGCAVVLDGLISTAAGLIASLINPDIAQYFISGHKSVEIGHKAALSHMNLTPTLDLNMRLGEGTGAALTIDIVDAACRVMREMASFEEAGVSGQE